MPNLLNVEVLANEKDTVHFVIRDSNGSIVFNHGFMSFRG